MRKDMAKVIVERPRYYRREVVNKLIGRQAKLALLEDAPRRQSMKRRWMNLKELNEHLKPLRRYLLSQVGKRWDDIYSEICRNISKKSAVQSHLLDHTMQYVIQNVIIVGGKPYSSTGEELLLSPYAEALFWVHPTTGIMHELPKPEPEAPTSRYMQIPIDELRRYIKIKGIWWEVQFEKVKPSSLGYYMPGLYSDIILEKEPLYQRQGISYFDLMQEWQAGIVAVSKRQLNSCQIKRMLNPRASEKRLKGKTARIKHGKD